jgi:hypothetical protein
MCESAPTCSSKLYIIHVTVISHIERRDTTYAAETLLYSPTPTHLTSNLYIRVTLTRSSESLAVLTGAQITNSADIQECH